MDESQVLELLQKAGAFRAGHFVFTSGRHSDTYINKDALFVYTRETSALCREIASRFADKNIDAVLGPAVAAAILAQGTAYHMSEMNGREVASVYADKDGQGGFVIRRGYNKVIKGKRVLVVEDLVTTGSSIKKVVDAARAAGAEVVGAIALCNRGDVTAEMVGNPGVFDQLLKVHLESWEEADCELCQGNIPVNTEVGHGAAYLAKKGA